MVSAEDRILQRVVFPTGEDTSVWPLYLDWGAARIRPELRELPRPPRDSGRREIIIPPLKKISLSTYFNAFPAAYWQRWTSVAEVTLRIVLEGEGAIDVMRSSARGTFVRVDGVKGEGEFHFRIPLDRFGDGGWLWFDIESGSDPVRLVEAEWRSERPALHDSKVTVAITTFNMPQACVEQIDRLMGEPEVAERISQIVIADQGTKHVRDEKEFSAQNQKYGSRVRVIEQANLGGSGGFSRGMFEMLHDSQSDHVLLLDDDAEAEPEGILRAVSFADYALKPTIVGGHMLNFNERTILHSFGEKINPYTFWWESVDPMLSQIDLAQCTIRNYPPLNRRVDVSYNGWWMCLIPRAVVEEIGLSLPFFIKWDDAEYGLRAAEHGIPTVSLPGVAVWHVPWTEKDDGLDWQAYFHQRNRWVAALLHSPYKRGGILPKKSFASDVKHLLSQQYFAAQLRVRGAQDVLAGPVHLAPSILHRAAEARSLSRDFDDARLIRAVQDFPDVHRRHLPRKGEGPEPPRSQLDFAAKAITGVFRQLRSVAKGSQDYPEVSVPNSMAKWWLLANVDSALVSNAEGSGVWFYHRNRGEFMKLALTSYRLHRRLRRRWERLAKVYRRALPDVVSPDAWSRIFNQKSDTQTH